MRDRAMVSWMSAGLILACALFALPGCSQPGSISDYFVHRGNDAAQMMDLGVTTSSDPYLSVYACLLGLSSIGAGHVDGQFCGMGGGQVGVMRHYHKVCGLLLWTYEELGWGDFDVANPETLYRWHNGPIGYISYGERKPAYGFS